MLATIAYFVAILGLGALMAVAGNILLATPSRNAPPAIGLQLGVIIGKLDTIMAQLDDLNTALDRIANDARASLDQAKQLQDELTQLQANTPPEVDLSAQIAKANAIADSLEGIAAAATPAPDQGGDAVQQG